MYAVIKSGGKQYRVAPGQTIQVESLEGEVGAEVVFGEVLAVMTEEKNLLVAGKAAGTRVAGTITLQDRHPKRMVMKFKKTKQYKICRGHRQNYTAVRVNEITVA